MGLLLGKLGKKKSAIEELEGIDKEIKHLEESRKDTELTRRRIVGRFVLVSVIVYILVAFIFYFFFFPASFYDRLYYIMPLIVAPVIIIVLKRTMAWYFNKKITKAQTKLSKLQEEKKRLIDKVMETETYKVAKQILDKYAPDQNKKPPIATSLTPYTPSAGLRQRNLPKDATPAVTPGKPLQPFKQTASRGSAPSIFSTPVIRPNISRTSVPTLPNLNPKQGPPFAVPPPQTPSNVLATIPPTPTAPTPKSILPRDRSVFDKMVDYLVGDGPSNRYALICQHCYSHNGMALKEEAKYTSFRCCYCYAFNPALVKKPQAPKLEYGRSSPITLRRHSTSESDKNESSETEDEEIKKAIKSSSHNQGTESSEGDAGKDFGNFSEIERKFSEIESTIAEIKKAEVESTDEEILNETNRKESNLPENELASFEFVSITNTNEESQSLMNSEDNKESPDENKTEMRIENSENIKQEHDNANQKYEEASTSLCPTNED
ncbi:endoplasmic reticulum junction formation protein lunapark-B isoform X2 [Agrilus planipennis]|uniref:Endoplasmic reticulum junction formation protein lunapark n=1 Tax=Agrilus planipennis TaxID=224129 RepID=A0A7F5R9R3_AGRPL|nr:endoplasmic reticulum junction formation protein lunapark-B isoform X2 [Agrilus planipennis]